MITNVIENIIIYDYEDTQEDEKENKCKTKK